MTILSTTVCVFTHSRLCRLLWFEPLQYTTCQLPSIKPPGPAHHSGRYHGCDRRYRPWVGQVGAGSACNQIEKINSMHSICVEYLSFGSADVALWSHLYPAKMPVLPNVRYLWKKDQRCFNITKIYNKKYIYCPFVHFSTHLEYEYYETDIPKNEDEWNQTTPMILNKFML